MQESIDIEQITKMIKNGGDDLVYVYDDIIILKIPKKILNNIDYENNVTPK